MKIILHTTSTLCLTLSALVGTAVAQRLYQPPRQQQQQQQQQQPPPQQQQQQQVPNSIHHNYFFRGHRDRRHRRPQQQRHLVIDDQYHCGCQQCDAAMWAKPAVDYSGSYSCGERIEYTKNTYDLSEEDACILVAGKEFAATCGIECNPNRCDGRNTPYPVVDEIPPASGQLQPDTPLYCYPSYAQRKRWDQQVWANNFVMEAKETPAGQRCGPGDSVFSQDAVNFDTATQELTLEFKKINGLWTGSEVRLVLPQAEMPFTYGTYEWSVKSIEIFKRNGNSNKEQVVSNTLPPSIVLGLFSWDALENFDIRENFNHEVDIELSQFTDVGGPDVNLLVQPVGLPQHGKYYSGGSPGQYDQAGHIYKFDWNPNNITWFTDAAGGINHVYSADDILYYASPAYVQCMPANVEMRINLWNVFGVSKPIDMTDDMRVKVVIDNFTYTKSGETSVPLGGSCTKHCQCSSPDAYCAFGECKLLVPSEGGDSGMGTTEFPTFGPTSSPDGTKQPSTTSPDLVATEVPTMGNAPSTLPVSSDTGLPFGEQTNRRTCAANPRCAHLSGLCCPTVDNVRLYCCGP